MVIGSSGVRDKREDSNNLEDLFKENLESFIKKVVGKKFHMHSSTRYIEFSKIFMPCGERPIFRYNEYFKKSGDLARNSELPLKEFLRYVEYNPEEK